MTARDAIALAEAYALGREDFMGDQAYYPDRDDVLLDHLDRIRLAIEAELDACAAETAALKEEVLRVRGERDLYKQDLNAIYHAAALPQEEKSGRGVQA